MKILTLIKHKILKIKFNSYLKKENIEIGGGENG